MYPKLINLYHNPKKNANLNTSYIMKLKCHVGGGEVGVGVMSGMGNAGGGSSGVAWHY